MWALRLRGGLLLLHQPKQRFNARASAVGVGPRRAFLVRRDSYLLRRIVKSLPNAVERLHHDAKRYTELVAPHAAWKLSAAFEGQEWRLEER